MSKSPIIEELIKKGSVHHAHESIIGKSHISDITVRPDTVAHTIRNLLVQSRDFENVKYIGNNVIEVMFNGIWYTVEVTGSIGNLFI